MLIPPDPSNLCPRDFRPNGNPIKLPGTTSSPYKSTTQRTGRANSSPPDPQRIRTSRDTSATAFLKISGRTFMTGRGGAVRTNLTHMPFSVRSQSSPSRQRSICPSPAPQPRANPSNALVGWPCSSNADLNAGPRRVSSFAAVSKRTSGISSANRRAVYSSGVHCRFTSRCSGSVRPTSAKSRTAERHRSIQKERSEAGGSSSVPSSNSTVRVSLISIPAESPAPRAPHTAPLQSSVRGCGSAECTSAARLPKWHDAHPRD